MDRLLIIAVVLVHNDRPASSSRASSASPGLQSVSFQYNRASTELPTHLTHNTKRRSGII